MGFLDKLKKTLWNSFFGEPDRERKLRRVSKKKVRPLKKKSKTVKKNKPPLKKPVKKIAVKVKPAVKTKAVLPKSAPQKTVKLKPVSVKTPRPAAGAKSAPPSEKVLPPQGVRIGYVTHFFSQVKVAAIKIEAQKLSVGDEIQIKGATTNFKTKIDSMQINRVPVTLAPKGSEIGILVKKRVREGDEVYKL